MSDYANADLMTAELVRQYDLKPRWFSTKHRYRDFLYLYFKFGAFEKFEVGSGSEKIKTGTPDYEVVLKQWHSPARFAGMENVLKKGFEHNGRIV